MSLLSRGQAMLARLGKVAGGVSVTYQRGSSGSPSPFVRAGITAWVGTNDNTRLQIGSTENARIGVKEREYILATADLVDGNSVAFLPKAGDRIVETIAGVACTFVVQMPDLGESPFEYVDSARTLVRVRTKQMK